MRAEGHERHCSEAPGGGVDGRGLGSAVCLGHPPALGHGAAVPGRPRPGTPRDTHCQASPQREVGEALGRPPPVHPPAGPSLAAGAACHEPFAENIGSRPAGSSRSLRSPSLHLRHGDGPARGEGCDQPLHAGYTQSPVRRDQGQRAPRVDYSDDRGARDHHRQPGLLGQDAPGRRLRPPGGVPAQQPQAHQEPVGEDLAGHPHAPLHRAPVAECLRRRETGPQ
mmetsp:Transcript_33483/g.99770  ORF Transcript_33483/g.99770 Transcript_33483/m.99770 type:complete len:224 (+) Transcript_33483:303-974(+)